MPHRQPYIADTGYQKGAGKRRPFFLGFDNCCLIPEWGDSIMTRCVR
jgi:hypothetical protein